MKKESKKSKNICIVAGSVLAVGVITVIFGANVKKRKKYATVEYVEPWKVF